MFSDDLANSVVYAAVKFVAYSSWCYAALKPVQSAAPTIASALKLGAVRWLIGLGFGIVVFFGAGSIDASAAARTYFLIYTPLRAVEWYLMARIIVHGARYEGRPWSGATISLPVWCVGGMLVSFLTDLLSPDGVRGRFCVGRCLC